MSIQLEDDEFVSKKINAELPSRVEYSLKEIAQSVLPVITVCGKWGDVPGAFTPGDCC